MATDERGVLTEYLDTFRQTLQRQCADLTPVQLATRSVPPSTLSLLGLVRHLAKVERYWFQRVMAGHDVPWLYRTEADPDGDFNGAVGEQDVVDDAWRSWREGVAFAERYVADHPDLDLVGRTRHGEDVTLREVLVHMIEEYARHCGHADLLRECLDGRVRL